MEDRSEIETAIDGFEVIEFDYEGRRRRAEPHKLGYDGLDYLTLSAWQLSDQRSLSGWREYQVKRVSRLTRTGEQFAGARPGYDPKDASLAPVVRRI